MSSLGDTPNVPAILNPENAWMQSNEEREKILNETSMIIARKFVNIEFHRRSNKSSGDSVHDYSRHLLSIGCLYFEMRDAIKEGDGEQVLQCWRYLLPLFHNSERKNYTVEVFQLLYKYHNGLPPRQAQQLIWSRFVNTKGIGGKNIPLDLHLEHLNRVCKTAIGHVGPNKTDDAIVRCAKVLGPMCKLLQNFDDDNDVCVLSGAHKKPSYQKDLNIVLDELLHYEVFKIIPGRFHCTFKKPTNILHSKPAQSTITWVMEHLNPRVFEIEFSYAHATCITSLVKSQSQSLDTQAT